MWKGILVYGIGQVLPGTEESVAMEIAEMIFTLVGIVWALYGALMKAVRGRWSAPA